MTARGRTLVAVFGEAAARRADAEGSAEPAFVRELRARARVHFEAGGLPHRRLEAWRSTSLAELERIDWTVPDDAAASAPVSPLALALPPLVLESDEAARSVLVDGRFDAARSSPAPAGAHTVSLRTARRGGRGAAVLAEVLGQLADPKTDGFVALGTALLDDGVLIEIERDASPERPLHVVLLGAAEQQLACPRLAVVARAGSRATLVLEHTSRGSAPRLAVMVGEIVLEAGASLDVVVVERESDAGLRFSTLVTRQARDARLAVHTLTLGGAIVRSTIRCELADTGAEVSLRGLFIGAGTRHVDHYTTVDHAMPHGTSRELYKGILGGRSRGVFRGQVQVRPGAQKTDSTQSNPNLLLGAGAEIDSQPQLEIHADDVKCSHGSTIGRLDEEALFYLRARGLARDAARALLTRGFASEIVDALPGEALRRRAGQFVEAALDAAIGGEGHAARGPDGEPS